MLVKFKKSLDDFDYLVMFDLASKITGVCLFDIKNNKIIETRILKVEGKYELPSYELRRLLNDYLNYLICVKLIDIKRVLWACEAMPTQVGGGSTIQTFMALAGAHTTLNNFLYENGLATYDYVGVYPISTHAYYKHLVGADSKYKVTKEDLKNYLVENYSLSKEVILDESDAAFLAVTLIHKKWDADLDTEIRNLKKHQKTLKKQSAIDGISEQLQFLQQLKTKRGK